MCSRPPIAFELSQRGRDVTFVRPEELRPQLAAEPFVLWDGDCGIVLGRRRDEVAIERALRRALDSAHASTARGFAGILATERGVDRACDEIDGFLRGG